ncbi:MAG TPA: hypothetical protein GXX15_12330 [Clostridia bacterium]|nr:hypothetical protein [Clostridia bacterium]
MSESKKIAWFTPGDVDAALGVFFDGFSKIIIGVTVITSVMKMPPEILFGKIISATGLAVLIALIWNTYLARKTGFRTKNFSITALPGGVAVGTFFVRLFAVMLPVYFATKSYEMAWKVGVMSNIFHSILLLLFAFTVEYILKYVPTQAIFGGLAGGSVAWLILATLGDAYAYPTVIIPALFILLTLYFGKLEIKNLSPGIVGVGIGTIIAWLSGAMNGSAVIDSFKTLGFYIPLPQMSFMAADVINVALKYLPITIAFAFADTISGIQAIEQAAAGGDKYNVRETLVGLSIANLIGAFIGNPFSISYYWGHPAWKRAKAGATYPLFVGIFYVILCATGIVAIATSILPSAATIILIIYAGITSFSQAFEVNEKKYFPAISIGVAIPIFELIYGKVNNGIEGAKIAIGEALKAKGIDFSLDNIVVSTDHLAQAGVSKGYLPLSQGSMLIAIIYTAILTFIIDKKWLGVSGSFLVASIFSFFGLIHADGVAINAAPTYTMIYLLMSGLFAVIYFLTKNESKKIEGENT